MSTKEGTAYLRRSFYSRNYFSKGIYQTLDLDYDVVTFPVGIHLLPSGNLACTTGKVNSIASKMRKCPNLIDLLVEPSSKKGFHARFICKIDCVVCRLVFDQVRVEADSERPKQFCNLLYDTKNGY